MTPPSLAAALALLATLPLSAAAREPVPAATPAGKSVSCIALNQIRETRVRSDSVIDFVMSGGRVYRNSLPYACPRLGFEQRFGYSTSINQLCSADIITVLASPPGVGGPSCGLGQFQPVTIEKAGRR